jgi:hypothetical protein
MRIHSTYWQVIRVATTAGMVLSGASACKPAATPAAPAKPAGPKISAALSAPTNSVVASASVFEQLMPPQGRDPFFPNSRRRDPEPTKTTSPEKAPATAVFVLKGVVGSPSHRLALINDNTIMGVGDTDSVRVGTGRVKLKCVEIGEDYAVIQVEGDNQTKRLQLSKKGL